MAKQIKPPCPICRIPEKDQHSLREAARCDAIRRKALDPEFELHERHLKPIRHENAR